MATLETYFGFTVADIKNAILERELKTADNDIALQLNENFSLDNQDTATIQKYKDTYVEYINRQIDTSELKDPSMAMKVSQPPLQFEQKNGNVDNFFKPPHYGLQNVLYGVFIMISYYKAKDPTFSKLTKQITFKEIKEIAPEIKDFEMSIFNKLVENCLEVYDFYMNLNEKKSNHNNKLYELIKKKYKNSNLKFPLKKNAPPSDEYLFIQNNIELLKELKTYLQKGSPSEKLINYVINQHSLYFKNILQPVVFSELKEQTFVSHYINYKLYDYDVKGFFSFISFLKYYIIVVVLGMAIYFIVRLYRSWVKFSTVKSNFTVYQDATECAGSYRTRKN